jgi:CheY-like chemotaxis protein
MSSIRILVAEDDDALRQLLKDALLESGYEVAEASNGLEAISVFQERSPDVVLLDIASLDFIDPSSRTAWQRSHSLAA